MGGKMPGRKTSNFLRMVEKRVANPLMKPMVQRIKHFSLQCFGEPPKDGFFLGNLHPSILISILTTNGVNPCDLARLEATCTYFKRGSNVFPGNSLSIPELAALDMCEKRTRFKSMATEKKNILKQKCGGSWKLVLKYLVAIEEACPRSWKSHVAAGCGHSVVVSSQGAVYSFGLNNFGQLGHGTYDNEQHPRVISSLRGIRVVQAVVRHHKTMLVTDCGHVYASGITTFGEHEVRTQDAKIANNTKPQLVKSLENIFVVQIAIGQYFTVVLSREGRVYSLSWGKETKLVHNTEPDDLEPRHLDGPLENIPVVQISAGYCYLLALAFEPTGLSVYSVGCGLGGKLGHGSTEHELKVRLVETLRGLTKPVMIAAGCWHIAVVGKDGRVCTWGWGNKGCLGLGIEDFVTSPKVVEGLKDVKIDNVATGCHTTFAVTDDGDVYSFGSDSSWNLGQISENGDEGRRVNLWIPKIAAALKLAGDRIIQISPTNSRSYYQSHTLVLTESGKLYAFGYGENGQLGIKLPQNEKKTVTPLQVDLNLS